METLRQSLALVFVFALLWMAVWFLRKKGWTAVRRTKRGPGLLESRARLALSARHTVHLVQVGDRNMILVLHPDGVTFLGDVVCARDCQQRERAAT